MPVGVYLRVSSEEQRERQSIATQRDFATRYADLHGLSIHKTYADDGISGTVPLEQRPSGVQLLEDAQRRKFDQLLVYKLDRLGRDTRLILNAVAELEKHGVRVRSMTEEFDTATATGRLMLTMLSGFAAHERELIRERSVAGTNRLAEAGAWLGGVVPYGYRINGETGIKRGLAISNDPIPGQTVSEADVIRTIYRMSAVEKKSCQKIADHLNRTGVPYGSVDGAPGTGTGKRKRRLALAWGATHIRNMIVTKTYMGIHEFGKRASNRERKIIAREVPAIVSEQLWQTAQQVLRSNQIMSNKNAREPFLLRGLIKCGLCGLTYSGIRINTRKRVHYYRCNGRYRADGLHGLVGVKCNGKSLQGDYVEDLVWADIESFLRNPGEILERLRERVSMDDDERNRRQKELDCLAAALKEKAAERERVLGLFRRGRIDEATLDRQLDLIDVESSGLEAEIETATRVLSSGDRTAQLQSAESLLATLRSRLDGQIPPDLRRRIIEILVESIQANTVERWGVQQSEIVITYCFSQPDEPAALVLPRSHRLNGNRDLEQLNTIGDHLLRRRLVLKLLQRQVAQRLKVDVMTVRNWENSRNRPRAEHMPAILQFLGYNPEQVANTQGERLKQRRIGLGMSRTDTAQALGVNPSTIARWERAEREPGGEFALRLNQFLEPQPTSQIA